MTYFTIYTSTPREKLTLKTLMEITETSQKNNLKNNITGILLGIENKFMQYFEGSEENVNELFDKIWRDPRHKNVTQWIKGFTDARVFKEWSMGSWMLSNDELKTNPALADLKKFLDNPMNDELQVKKFMAMMNDLLKTWIAHEPERLKKIRDELSS
ncbi:BLUF domain-containing protein [Ekhidna sp.]|uniref:BLUF domain-containing protein n=1 Tax=Ekhidna sp. TaxID=2608089 RepID=UPI0032987722